MVTREEVKSWDEAKLSATELSMFKGLQSINMERGRRESMHLDSQVPFTIPLPKETECIDSQTTCEAMGLCVGLEPQAMLGEEMSECEDPDLHHARMDSFFMQPDVEL